jgi:hypothetical protein
LALLWMLWGCVAINHVLLFVWVHSLGYRWGITLVAIVLLAVVVL